jgi:AcrR family transcriptional regulator
MAKKPFKVKQSRSRESLERLLNAATDVLNERGLEGATIPRIAARAGLSPGAVYRRFPDKDALLQTVVLTELEQNDESAKTQLTPEFAEQGSLKQFAKAIIQKSLQEHRQYSTLKRTLEQYALTHPNAAFRNKCFKLNIRTIRRVADFLLLKRKEIKHPDPEVAVSFALIQLAFTLRDLTLLDTISEDWSSILPKDDDQLLQELTRAFLSYLGVK